MEEGGGGGVAPKKYWRRYLDVGAKHLKRPNATARVLHPLALTPSGPRRQIKMKCLLLPPPRRVQPKLPFSSAAALLLLFVQENTKKKRWWRGRIEEREGGERPEALLHTQQTVASDG